VFCEVDPALHSLCQGLREAYTERISLSSTGYYRDTRCEVGLGQGRRPALPLLRLRRAVAEVEVDGFSGMHRVRRVDSP